MLNIILERQSIDQMRMATKDRTLVAIVLWINERTEYLYQ